MREIKFRGKRLDNGEWVYGNPVEWRNEQEDVSIVCHPFGCCIDANGNLIMVEAPFVCKVIPDTVGQYTGLKDKNGVEIYEGDIIWWGKDEPAPASNVIFDDGAFKVSDTRELLADVLNGADVISNIHDSPDFLGVTE